MHRLHPAVRRVLLGPDGTAAGRILCGRNAIIALAAVALSLHALDLLTGIRMIQTYGLAAEQNPLARGLFEFAGPMGLGVAKLTVVGCGVCALAWLAERGRPRLARNALVAVAMLGLLGFSSNLI